MPPELTAALSLCRNLPSPPGIAMRIIALAQDPETDIASAAEVIALDAALSARMLRIANSPLYASRRRIENLGQALTMLGLNATLQLALGFSLLSGLRQGSSEHALYEKIWRRSVLSGLSARLLGDARGVRRSEELLLAGLLQDIGILALLQTQPDTYPAVLAECTGNSELLAREQEHYQGTHALIGAGLVEHWDLPRYLVDAISNSEPPGKPEDTFQQCVAVSGLVADIWLDADTDAARESALYQAELQLGMDSPQFESVLTRVSELLPDICALFDTHIPSPARVQYLLEHAAELVTLRNLRELQDAAQARQQADEFEIRMRGLAEQAHLDVLTGVINRRQLENVLEEEFVRAKKLHRPLSIAFIDLDDFKKINDEHGHLTGDEVLRTFASKLQELLRSSDTIARFGGEEFILVFPGTLEDTAVEIVQRVLSTISKTPVAEPAGTQLFITFSAGVATHGAYERFSTVQELLHAADDALYRSKHLGRNQVFARSPALLQQAL